MELEWLEDFASLARTGNFSRSAEERHVTVPVLLDPALSPHRVIGALVAVRSPALAGTEPPRLGYPRGSFLGRVLA